MDKGKQSQIRTAGQIKPEQAKTGWTLPVEASEYGMAMAQTLYPMYSGWLVVSTVLIVMLTTTIVSYWPSKKIAKMNPTEALRGKIQ